MHLFVQIYSNRTSNFGIIAFQNFGTIFRDYKMSSRTHFGVYLVVDQLLNTVSYTATLSQMLEQS